MNMPYTGFTKFLLVVGFLSLLHAAYSAAQRKRINYRRLSSKKSMMIIHISDRTYLRDTDQEKTNTFLPLDVSIMKRIWCE